MAEYIEREDARLAVMRAGSIGNILPQIEAIPAEDVAPVVHGRWKKSRIPVPVYGGIEISCSSCGRIAAHEYNYCPNCGAKMDGE